jgi:hypothetical protein
LAARDCSSLSVSLEALVDGNRRKTIDVGTYSSSAPSALPHGKDLFLCDLPAFPKKQEQCAVCDLNFAREPVHFLGAMYISYGLGVSILASIAALRWLPTGWWITNVTIWAVVLILPFAPTITVFRRVLWIYLDQSGDPERSR